MIVDSMTLREIHKEIHDDIQSIGRTLDNRLALFRSAVLRSHRYPILRRYECKSLVRRNRFFVQMKALKRSDHSDPICEFYCVYDRPEGLYCALMDAAGKNTFVFPPHFFSRYRERVTGDNGMSGIDMIHHFISRVWGLSLTFIPDEQQGQISSWDDLFMVEEVNIMGVVPDGVLFGEYVDNVFLIKTIVTQDMLFENQLDVFEDLYDHYYEMIYATFPEKVADYIIDLEPDYFRPDPNKLKEIL